MLAALLFGLIAGVPARAQQAVSPKAAEIRRPAPAANPDDEYFAYFVRTTVARHAPAQKSPTGPTVVGSLLITEGPMTMAEGLDRSLEIRRDGVCRIVAPTLGTPGRATCYPPHLVRLVEVFSPQQ